jgi:hypothetical protein
MSLEINEHVFFYRTRSIENVLTTHKTSDEKKEMREKKE